MKAQFEIAKKIYAAWKKEFPNLSEWGNLTWADVWRHAVACAAQENTTANIKSLLSKHRFGTEASADLKSALRSASTDELYFLYRETLNIEVSIELYRRPVVIVSDMSTSRPISKSDMKKIEHLCDEILIEYNEDLDAHVYQKRCKPENAAEANRILSSVS